MYEFKKYCSVKIPSRVGGEKKMYHCNFVSPSQFAVIWANPAGFGSMHEITAQMMVQIQRPERKNRKRKMYQTIIWPILTVFKACDVKKTQIKYQLRASDFAAFNF